VKLKAYLIQVKKLFLVNFSTKFF